MGKWDVIQSDNKFQAGKSILFIAINSFVEYALYDIIH